MWDSFLGILSSEQECHTLVFLSCICCSATFIVTISIPFRVILIAAPAFLALL